MKSIIVLVLAASVALATDFFPDEFILKDTGNNLYYDLKKKSQENASDDPLVKSFLNRCVLYNQGSTYEEAFYNNGGNVTVHVRKYRERRKSDTMIHLIYKSKKGYTTSETLYSIGDFSTVKVMEM